jgi:hypothetical protein
MQTYDQPAEYAYCEGCNADMSDTEYEIMWNDMQDKYQDNPTLCDSLYHNDEQMLASKCDYYTPEIVQCCNCKKEIPAHEALYADECEWACSKDCQQILNDEIKKEYERMRDMEIEIEDQIRQDREYIQETNRWSKCNKEEKK